MRSRYFLCCASLVNPLAFSLAPRLLDGLTMATPRRATTLAVLCSVSVLLLSACSRHTVRTARLGSPAVSAKQKYSATDRAHQPTDRAGTPPNVKRSAATVSRGAAAKSGAAGAEAGGKDVRALEVWSTEVRHRVETSAAATRSQPPQPGSLMTPPVHRGHQDGRGMWLGLVGMLVIAAVVIGAFAFRRSSTPT